MMVTSSGRGMVTSGSCGTKKNSSSSGLSSVVVVGPSLVNSELAWNEVSFTVSGIIGNGGGGVSSPPGRGIRTRGS